MGAVDDPCGVNSRVTTAAGSTGRECGLTTAGRARHHDERRPYLPLDEAEETADHPRDPLALGCADDGRGGGRR